MSLLVIVAVGIVVVELVLAPGDGEPVNATPPKPIRPLGEPRKVQGPRSAEGLSAIETIAG